MATWRATSSIISLRRSSYFPESRPASYMTVLTLAHNHPEHGIDNDATVLKTLETTGPRERLSGELRARPSGASRPAARRAPSSESSRYRRCSPCSRLSRSACPSGPAWSGLAPGYTGRGETIRNQAKPWLMDLDRSTDGPSSRRAGGVDSWRRTEIVRWSVEQRDPDVKGVDRKRADGVEDEVAAPPSLTLCRSCTILII